MLDYSLTKDKSVVPHPEFSFTKKFMMLLSKNLLKKLKLFMLENHGILTLSKVLKLIKPNLKKFWDTSKKDKNKELN